MTTQKTTPPPLIDKLLQHPTWVYAASIGFIIILTGTAVLISINQ